ncbi:MAG: bifunctional ornithine acetyltransferase/N-acetylglutamate synthase [Cobetia sp.]|uniref:bifunctional glutamate N-acetyltransferase/amino-acid acetyltransferase ArgJ n=1 Tax=unclassified Cobetia TaxID=2609414 RepID=UPI000C64B998|nr:MULTISPECIES: bifunctional glutamate N-acetyltransferase/amino-acid acetyltransferase ArgJ [unclassified Cobetia]MBF07620.1 bifunctional ornithine acetyltransferase/N-acetylglutamate synthase [Cobetia sp.]MBK08087.1 bifunctional ornithine acetyltransferase/N-acetylglutamate synthase [Cobetia sp.]MDH2294850.1 bifunctional glutamate N-acetyltransferase/amino-acid acetyltransferase ArgJ [Cobetia sp. 1AS1]HAR09566.1 bifunctional ornithine acetyltransferase/N-acetylglutamate synthase [Cobetia sp.
MAVGPSTFPADMPAIAGFQIGVAEAGIKKPGRRDLVIMALEAGSRLAGTFTRNAFCAAPVHVAREHLTAGVDGPRYLVINTGNANAGTGEQGMTDARATCQALAEIAGCDAKAVLPFSTGVIGEPLPMDRLTAALPTAFADLGEGDWSAAAHGIMTTDTRPKGSWRTLTLSNGESVTLAGVSKGSGMICPNMATMLGFVATDADLAIDQAALDAMLRRVVVKSFNSITVDSDTSTNDACMLAVTGQAGRVEGEDLIAFEAALAEVMLELAQAIIRDGEGATKFVTIEVSEARSQEEARAVGFTVAHSPLVKTALYASDANWGRILAAVGRAPLEELDVTGVAITLNGVTIVEQGGRADSYTEAAGSAAMAEEELVIGIRLGRGQQEARIWTSDLSHDYVSINADYRS